MYHGDAKKVEAKGQSEILKYRKLNELEFVEYLQPLIVQYLQSWTQLKDEEAYYKN
jgi:hypothetical protein